MPHAGHFREPCQSPTSLASSVPTSLHSSMSLHSGDRHLLGVQRLSEPLRVHSMYKNAVNLDDSAFLAVRIFFNLRTAGCGKDYEEYQDREV